MSTAAIIENRRGNSLLSRLLFNPESSSPVADTDAQFKQKSIWEITFQQIKYVMIIITSQGLIFIYKVPLHIFKNS